MIFDCEKSCVNDTCTYFTGRDAFYKKIISTFIKNNYLLHQIPTSVKLGLFLYDVRIQKIVYADERFMVMNGINKHVLIRPAMTRIVFSKMHPNDLRRFVVLHRIAEKKGHAPFINGLLRFKRQRSYDSYYFMVMQPEVEGRVCSNFRVGIQISQSPLENNTPAELDELEHYQELVSSLSEREQEILQLIVKGQTDKTIGESLIISTHTAKKHRKNILQKLGVSNTASLAYIAGKSSLIN